MLRNVCAIILFFVLPHTLVAMKNSSLVCIKVAEDDESELFVCMPKEEFMNRLSRLSLQEQIEAISHWNATHPDDQI